MVISNLNIPGNVGIGITSPSTKLHVEDGSLFIGDISSGFSTVVPSANTSNGTPNGHRLFFDNSFNNSIGTGMPANKIVLHNNLFTSGFGLESGAVTYHSGNGHRIYCNADSTSTYGSLALSVFSTQTVVNTNTNGEGLLKIANLNANTGAYSMLRVGNDIGDTVMFLNSSTRVADGGTNTFTIRNDPGPFRLQSTFGSGILISTSGNVGIGSSNPSALLDVNGLSKTVTLEASGIIKTAGCPVMAMNTVETKAGHTVFIHPLQMEGNVGIGAGVSSGIFHPTASLGTSGAGDQTNLGGYFRPGGNQQYDFYRTYINLVAGTYTFRLDCSKATDRGIATIRLNDVTVGSIETWFQGITYGTEIINSIVVATTGVYKFEIQINTHDTRSGGFQFLFRSAGFIRTS